jgi:hypothetical protein
MKSMSSIPVRRLKQRCPCCKGEGYLELFSCSECKKIFAICELVFTQFTDPLDIKMDKVYDGDPKKCGNCGAVNKLQIANDYELAACGLKDSDYE